MKKRLLRLSKRILILSLCTCLVSGSVINKYKITANATAIAASLSAYGAYEICLYLGTALAASCGVAAVIDNRDELAELGKNFVDSMNLDEVSGWVLTKVNTAGQSYVYGSEALQEVKDMAFTVIQGGGNKPENDDDNDGDGDVDADDRTVELKNLGLWATSSFANLLCEQVQPILDKVQAGETNPISNVFPLNEEAYSGLKRDSLGNYVGVVTGTSCYWSEKQIWNKFVYDISSKYPVCAYINSAYSETDEYPRSEIVFRTLDYKGEPDYFTASGVLYRQTSANSAFEYMGDVAYSVIYLHQYSSSLPIFSSLEAADNFLLSGVDTGVLNASQVYQIADWLQEQWISALTQLNTGIRSLNDNMLIVGEAMNQAMQNQLNGLGYISAIGEGVAGAVPMALPGTIAEPIYYPGDSSTPALTPDEFPWKTPAGSPGTDGSGTDDGSGNEDSSPSEEEIRGKDPSGIQLLFGTLFDLIMILLMLLMIFLSCLAFIVMIFRIEPTTGFLPEEMIAGLEYIKTLQIPGFGMSVYDFFMALIYIILIFTVIGILRKNIDKLKFPRKGKW